MNWFRRLFRRPDPIFHGVSVLDMSLWSHFAVVVPPETSEIEVAMIQSAFEELLKGKKTFIIFRAQQLELIPLVTMPPEVSDDDWDKMATEIRQWSNRPHHVFSVPEKSE